MRADRLLSILMILQGKGKTSVRQLAEELEVSVRTIHRDIDALSDSGVPVYFERGKNGGVTLLEGYRTNLTSLTADELKSLFILGIPASLGELGVSKSLKTALRKISASIPEGYREDEINIRSRIFIDWSGWGPGTNTDSTLQNLYTAVWENRRVFLRYLVSFSSRIKKEFGRKVKPYGLVAKTGEWYLVCDDDIRIRVYELSSILEAQSTGESFTRNADFDLGEFWTEWCKQQEGFHPSTTVTVLISPLLNSILSGNLEIDFEKTITSRERPDSNGKVKASLLFDTFEDARTYILGMGNSVEVLEPESLRLSIADYARQIAEMYHDSN
ncbi:MAG: YafY family transcriptional regulator [Dehalococcoidales bacterium]|nr:YafY family transcriptional regulator [Dehalococcoidales bacterium]